MTAKQMNRPQDFGMDCRLLSISYHGGDGNDVVLTEHGNAIGHAVHHASAMTAGDWLFT